MKLTKEQIDEIVAAAYPTPHSDAGTLRARLTRAFGERKNPYEMWRGSDISQLGRAAALFDAAAKVADGCYPDGRRGVGNDAYDDACAALKRIVEEIRGMA